MRQFVLRRLMLGILIIWGATALVFILMNIIPGDIARRILGDSSEGGILTPYTLEQLRKEMGLDRPLFVQYFDWLGGVFTGSLGKSLVTQESVAKEILSRLPVTAQLAFMAVAMGILIGIPIGIISALLQDSLPDYLLRGGSILFLAVPTFWLGLLVILLGARYFGWIPPIGRHLFWEEPWLSVKQLFWPALVIATHEGARNARMMRSTLLEVLREDYIRTARAKGLREQVVYLRHALRNALIPVVTMISLAIGGTLNGTIILEAVFSIPGIGSLLIDSVYNRDFIVVQGLVFYFAIIYVLVNLITDIAYGWLDPRISYK